MRATAAGALSAVLLAAGFAGCGGSTPLSLKDLRRDATTICQRASAQVAGVRTPTDPSGTAAFLAAGAAALRPELVRLRRLQAPNDQSAQYRTALGALAEELQLVRQTQASVAHTDPATAVAGLQQALAPVRSRGDAAWQALGIPACVSR